MMRATRGGLALCICPNLRRHIGLATLILCSLAGGYFQVAAGQVIPGVGMRADSRTEAAAYRLRVQNELMSVLDDWGRFTEQKDSSALASLYTSSAKSVAGRVEDASGPQDIGRQLGALSLLGAQVSITSNDFDTSGDIGFISCSLLVQPTTSGGPTATTTARALFILIRDFRGRWHIRQQTIFMQSST